MQPEGNYKKSNNKAMSTDTFHSLHSKSKGSVFMHAYLHSCGSGKG